LRRKTADMMGTFSCERFVKHAQNGPSAGQRRVATAEA
jgi:hypothetical protein